MKSGWPSGLRRCVQVAVSPGGVGSNPTSDNGVLVMLKGSGEKVLAVLERNLNGHATQGLLGRMTFFTLSIAHVLGVCGS